MKITREHEWQAESYRMESANFDRERANALFELYLAKVAELEATRKELRISEIKIRELKETVFALSRRKGRALERQTETVGLN